MSLIGLIFSDFSVVNDQDAVSHAHNGRFMHNHDGGAADLGITDRLQYGRLVGRIQCRSAFIKNEDL